MSNQIIFISVHPDDETLGCGGTILKHLENGDKLFWLIITNNLNEPEIWGEENVKLRQKEIKAVSELYNFEKVFNLNYSTTKLDLLPLGELTQAISKVIKEIKPEILYTHNRSDIHSDHRVSFNAVMSAVKSFNNPFIRKVLMYETVSETEFSPALQENAFIPNFFVDISKYIDKKIEIMKIYESELKEHPFPRSERNIRALASFRGAQCGSDSAEAFMLLKGIWK